VLTVKVDGVSDVVRNLGRVSGEFPKHIVARLTHDIHDKSIDNAKKHNRTGKLEDNIELRIKGLDGEVFVDKTNTRVMWRGMPISYAVFVHFGTSPHKILPKKRRSLRWAGDGKFIFAKEVQHPGYKGDRFMYNAARDVINKLAKISREELNEL